MKPQTIAWLQVALNVALVIIFLATLFQLLDARKDTATLTTERDANKTALTSLTRQVDVLTKAVDDGVKAREELIEANTALVAERARLAAKIRAQQADLDTCGIPKVTFPEHK